MAQFIGFALSHPEGPTSSFSLPVRDLTVSVRSFRCTWGEAGHRGRTAAQEDLLGRPKRVLGPVLVEQEIDGKRSWKSSPDFMLPGNLALPLNWNGV